MNEHLLYQLFECITVIFEAIIIYQYLNALFDKKCSKLKLFCGYAIFSLGLMYLSLFWQYSLLLIVYSVLGIFILIIFLYKSEIVSMIFYPLLFCGIVTSSEIICVGIFAVLGKVDMKTSMQYGLSRVLSIVVAKLIQIIAVKVIGILLKSRKNKFIIVDVEYIIPLLVCQVFSIALTYYVYIIGVEIYKHFNLEIFISMFGIIYINIIIFWYFDNIKISFDLKRINEACEIKMEMQKEYYSLLEEQQKETDALYHDMNKHIDLIKSLLDSGCSNATTEYVVEVEKKLASRPLVVRTSHPVISALLTMEKLKLTQLGVSLNLKVKLLSEIKLNPTDLCILIGNLFDNAAEACNLLTDDRKKQIDSEILQRGSTLLISIKNPYDLNVKNPVKRKKHGFGLKNVHKVVTKYSGDINIKTDDGFYSVQIVIP